MCPLQLTQPEVVEVHNAYMAKLELKQQNAADQAEFSEKITESSHNDFNTLSVN